MSIKLFINRAVGIGILIGRGTGANKWELGAVEHFDLYCISEANIQHGEKNAEIDELDDRVTN
jgi:hypothetical protein